MTGGAAAALARASLLMAQGQPAEALLALGDAAADDAATADLRGRALNNLGRVPDAVACFKQACELEPSHPAAHLHLGHCLLRLGQPAAAEPALRIAVGLAPADARAWSTLGRALTDLDRWGEACAAFGEAAALEPGSRDRHLDHGLALERLGDLDAAASAYACAADAAPGDPEVLVRSGLLSLSLGATVAAREQLSAALARDPARADAAAGILASFDAEGDVEGGLAWLGRADAAWLADPEVRVASALLHLNSGRSMGVAADMAALGADTTADPRVRALAWSLAGAAADAEGDVATAWSAWSASNGLQPARFNADAYRTYLDTLLRTPAPAMVLEGAATPRPILILGLPRSGTSLLEQMLSMHPAIAAGGERRTLGLFADRVRRAETKDELARYGAAYRADLSGFAGTATHATDKMWQNFEYLDVIAALLPDAVVVHISRHPLDVALSCFAQTFGYGGVPFSYDSDHIAQYISGYRELMAHWRQVLGLRMVDVRYEDLVADPEGALRRILDAAALPFDPACLSPHLSERVVTTASNAQVRRPIHGERRARWRRYAELLPEAWRALAEDH